MSNGLESRGWGLAGAYVDEVTPFLQFTPAEEEVNMPTGFEWSDIRFTAHYSLRREEMTQLWAVLYPTLGPVWLDLFTPPYERIIRGTSHA